VVGADQSWAENGSVGMKASQPNPCWVLRGQMWPEIHLQMSEEEREYFRLCLEQGRARFLLFASLSEIKPPKARRVCCWWSSGLWLCLLSVPYPKHMLLRLGWELSCLLAEIENCNLCVCLGEKESLFMRGKCLYVPAHAWERVFVWKCMLFYIYIYIYMYVCMYALMP